MSINNSIDKLIDEYLVLRDINDKNGWPCQQLLFKWKGTDPYPLAIGEGTSLTCRHKLIKSILKDLIADAIEITPTFNEEEIKNENV